MDEKEYLVEWQAEIWANSPEEAAKEAWNLLRASDSTANVFDVIEVDSSGEAVRIDVQELLEGEDATDE